jgi:hypothetical protein
MRIVLSLVLLTVLALATQGADKKKQPAKPAVPVLNSRSVPSNAVKQVITASPEIGEHVPAAVCSLEAGLLQVRKITDRPILAMAEREGWFFYATSVARDRDTDAPLFMISGYAVKRDSRRVISWGVW